MSEERRTAALQYSDGGGWKQALGRIRRLLAPHRNLEVKPPSPLRSGKGEMDDAPVVRAPVLLVLRVATEKVVGFLAFLDQVAHDRGAQHLTIARGRIRDIKALLQQISHAAEPKTKLMGDVALAL